MNRTKRVLIGIALALAILATAAHASMLTGAQKLDAYYALVNLNIQSHEYEKAVGYIDKCLALAGADNAPLIADLYLKKGVLQYEQGDRDNAVVNLKKALEVDPALSDARLVLAQIYADQQDTAGAIESMKTYIAEKPEEYTMYQTLGQLYFSAGQYDEAITAYSLYLEKADSPAPDAYYMRGVSRLQTGAFEPAAEDFGKAIDSEAHGQDARYNRGVCFLQLGKYAEAEADFAACIDAGAAIDGLYYNRGVSRMAQQKYEDAILDYKAAFDAGSYVADSMYNTGMCHLELKMYAEAAEDFKAYMEVAAEDKKDLGLYYRAICLMAAGDYEKAVEGFEELIDKPFNEDDARYNMAVCLLQLERYDDALKALDTSIKKGYEVAQCHYYRGVIYAAKGELEKAVKEYTANIKAGELLATSYYNRGMCYTKLGDAEKAQADLEKALTYEEETPAGIAGLEDALPEQGAGPKGAAKGG